MSEFEVTANLPPEVVEAFTSAAITALQELTQFESNSEQVSTVAAVERSDIVLATVALVRRVPGKMTVVLTEDTASLLAARYLPKDMSLTAELVEDVAGEIANVIAGQAKTILKGTPYHFKMSTPIVAHVPSFSQLPGVMEETLVASLTFDANRLLLLVELSPCPGA